MDDNDILPLDEDELAILAAQIPELPEEHSGWVAQLFLECRRARAAEARLLADGVQPPIDGEATQLVLDTADWLRTLWEVGYMGGDAFPAPPRSDFPLIGAQDILKSALFARIRGGKRPLPFPPPTRGGVPWHEVVESDQSFIVRAQVAEDGWVNIEGCTDWQLVDGANGAYRVQHRGKGPVYRLILEGEAAGTLQRHPPTLARRLLRQSRAGIDAYLLEWPREDGSGQPVPLRARDWERAEHEAQRWVAMHHPTLYGQIRFERHEA